MHAFFKQNRDILLMSAAFTTLIAAGGILNRTGFMNSNAKYEASPVIASVVEKDKTAQAFVGRTIPSTEKTTAAESKTEVLPRTETPFWMTPVEITNIEPALEPAKKLTEIPELAPKEIATVDPWFVPPTKVEPIVLETPVQPMTVVKKEEKKKTEPAARQKAAVSPMDDRYVDTFGVPLPRVDIIDVVPAESKPAVAKNNAKPEKTPPPVPKTSSEWIPFIYFYQKSYCRFVPDRILYVFPTISPVEPVCQEAAEQSSRDDKKQDAPKSEYVIEESPCIPNCIPCNTIQPMCPPMYYAPIVPMQPMPYQNWNYQAMPYPPTMQSAMLPVYMPSMVLPSRTGHGSPRLIYPNGVVVKPKVYYPGQPVKNVVRAVTP